MKKLIPLLAIFALLLVGCSAPNVMSKYAGFENKKHHFLNETPEAFVSNLEKGVEGIYFMGFAECPWCKELVPVLEETAAQSNHSIHYLNTKNAAYSTDKALQQRLQTWIAKLPAEDQNNGSVPFTIFIAKDGSIKTHLGTAPTHDAPKAKMTESEMNYLKTRLNEKFKTVTPNGN